MSEELMEKAIEVALLNERNTLLKSRLRVEKKARFDKQLTIDNLSYLYDIKCMWLLYYLLACTFRLKLSFS